MPGRIGGVRRQNNNSGLQYGVRLGQALPTEQPVGVSGGVNARGRPVSVLILALAVGHANAPNDTAIKALSDIRKHRILEYSTPEGYVVSKQQCYVYVGNTYSVRHVLQERCVPVQV